MSSELILPTGVEWVERAQSPPRGPEGRGLIVNETDLPDDVVQTYFEENASVIGLSSNNTFSTYIAQGSLMTRPKFRVPTTVMEEIILSRDMIDRDDDVGATAGAMIALAFGDGMQHAHEDETTVALFDEISSEAAILMKLKEMYHEWLIAAQLTTAVVFRRESLQYMPMGADRKRTRDVTIPMIAVIPSEQIRVLGNDIFGTADLAYRPFSGRQEQWLMEYFGKNTSAARVAEMRREDPILTTLLTAEIEYDDPQDVAWVYSEPRDPIIGRYVYRLNHNLVHRTTMPKGQYQHPRPLLARNFPLFEAKRLLTIMDYSLLEAGANFLVVARKGSDARPALPQEIANLRETIARASRSGVMIGDHRLDIEIITPKLDELLNPDKRKLIGRKLAMALLRVPDVGTSDGSGSNDVLLDTEILSRVIASDRDDIRLHLERNIYKLTSERNKTMNGYPHLWFPKIVLQGMQFFQDMILGLRDRGDIPRKYAVEAAGFNWTAAVQQRKLEKSSGDDKVMTPAAVPFSAPGPAGNGKMTTDGPGQGNKSSGSPGPQDRGGGRPNGAKTGRSKPKPPGGVVNNITIHRNAGETIKAMWDGEDGPIRRVGEATYSLLEEYGTNIGRISSTERKALERVLGGEEEIFTEGPLFTVPVNLEYALDDFKVVRLTDGISMIVGNRPEDDAILAQALLFRAPLTALDAEEFALRAGWEL